MSPLIRMVLKTLRPSMLAKPLVSSENQGAFDGNNQKKVA